MIMINCYEYTRKTFTGLIGDHEFDKNETIELSYYQTKEGTYYDQRFSTTDNGMVNYSVYKELPDEDGIVRNVKISSKTLTVSKALDVLRKLIKKIYPDTKTYEDFSLGFTPKGYHDEWKKQYEANMKRYKEKLNLKGYRTRSYAKKPTIKVNVRKMF